VSAAKDLRIGDSVFIDVLIEADGSTDMRRAIVKARNESGLTLQYPDMLEMRSVDCVWTDLYHKNGRWRLKQRLIE
jgi:hypothetical protein